MIKPKEWKEFEINNNNFDDFDTVSHVTHIDYALNIVRAGLLQPRLVGDKSKLNQRRILVSWLSPNDWFQGYRYGNVAFRFNWHKLVADRNVYWVEKMDEYRPVACRFLITEKNYDGDKDFQRYDQTKDLGPWQYRKSDRRHYRNKSICLEFMIEAEVMIDDCLETNFVKHHPSFCCVDPERCPTLGMSALQAGPLFLAGLLGQGLATDSLHMSLEKKGVSIAGTALRQAYQGVDDDLNGLKATGKVTSSDAVSTALARAVLSAYSRGDQTEKERLARLFASPEELTSSVKALVAAAFAVKKI